MKKVCTKCGAEKDIEEFRLRVNRAPGARNSNCKECCRKSSQRWKKNNPERTRELSRKSAAAFFKKYPEQVRGASRKQYAANPEKRKAQIYARSKERLASDPQARLRKNLRERVRSAMLGINKSEHTAVLIGCSWQHLRAWLEFWMKSGMTWDNYGEWHVDHKKPCSSFDLTKPEEQRKCFHYTNLEPLWAEDNLRKSDNLHW